MSVCCLTVLKLLLEKVCTALTNIPEEAIFPLIDFSGTMLMSSLLLLWSSKTGVSYTMNTLDGVQFQDFCCACAWERLRGTVTVFGSILC